LEDPSVRGLRVRVKNIQVDGVQIIRDLFAQKEKSYGRFADWFLGEIFVEPSSLVPNARRDGFEENASWREIRDELAAEAKLLGRKAYEMSADAQKTVEKLKERLEQAKKERDSLRRASFSDVDKVLKLSVDITKWKADVEKAAADADRPTVATLNEIGSELADIKTECLARINRSQDSEVDVEAIELSAKEELIQELMVAFGDKLSPKCMGEVRKIMRDHLGRKDL
jgi:molecular chaperone HtpG